MEVADLRRFRSYRNWILAHGRTELYHEQEYKELLQKVLGFIDSIPDSMVRSIAYLYYVNASSIHFISGITNYSIRQILRIRDRIENNGADAAIAELERYMQMREEARHGYND